MNTVTKLVVALLSSLLFASCMFDMSFEGKKGNGNVVSENRNVGQDFTAVKATEGLDVFVTQDDKTSIRVEADENVIDLIVTEVKNDVLVIHTEKNIGRATKNIYVSLPNITALKSSSGADLYTNGVVTSDKITLEATSGSDIEAKIEANYVVAETSSGADIKLSGKANFLEADASSGSDIKARNLEVKECNADASSGADISVNVTDKLTADASSGADIKYTGNPVVNTNKSSSGSVRKN